MNLSIFGEKLSGRSGIYELMEDLGNAVALRPDLLMLGGGNPAAIPEIQSIWRSCAQELLNNSSEFDQMLAAYDPPQGNPIFLDAFARLFREKFSWPITAENIAVANGAQTGIFCLLNMLAGRTGSNEHKKILIPLSPDYIGYADMGVENDMFIACPGIIAHPNPEEPRFFKYEVDFDAVRQALAGNSVAAMLVSRPTNPSGNVISQKELEKLDTIAQEFGVYLIVDNAYGGPFPGILEDQSQMDRPFYSKQTIQSFSLSKIGLPGLRTAFIVAPKDIVTRLAAVTAITGLANGNFGQRLTLSLFQSGEILNMSRQIVYPYYRERRKNAIELLTRELDSRNIDWQLHSSEGAFFLWLWIPNLKGSAEELYQRLKKNGVLVIPGEKFFYGLPSRTFQPTTRHQSPYCATCGSNGLSYSASTANLEPFNTDSENRQSKNNESANLNNETNMNNTIHNTANKTINNVFNASKGNSNIYINGIKQNLDPVFDRHRSQCIRISFSAPEDRIQKGFTLIADTILQIQNE